MNKVNNRSKRIVIIRNTTTTTNNNKTSSKPSTMQLNSNRLIIHDRLMKTVDKATSYLKRSIKQKSVYVF